MSGVGWLFLCSRRLSKPSQRFFVAGFGEEFDLWMHEMADDPRQFGEKPAVAHHSQFLDLLVMAFDKPHMSADCFEIGPPREGFCMNHHPRQSSMFRDVWVDLAGQALEIGRFE